MQILYLFFLIEVSGWDVFELLINLVLDTLGLFGFMFTTVGTKILVKDLPAVVSPTRGRKIIRSDQLFFWRGYEIGRAHV